MLQRNDALNLEQLAAEPTLELEQDELDLICDRWNETLDRIIRTPAATGAGIRAKGGALGHALMQRVAVELAQGFEQQAEDYEKLAMTLVRDLSAVPI